MNFYCLFLFFSVSINPFNVNPFSTLQPYKFCMCFFHIFIQLLLHQQHDKHARIKIWSRCKRHNLIADGSSHAVVVPRVAWELIMSLTYINIKWLVYLSAALDWDYPLALIMSGFSKGKKLLTSRDVIF